MKTLYDFYAEELTHRYKAGDGNSDNIRITVRLGQLPTHIDYNVDDVATMFKRIIIGLQGGLLGSLALFRAIQSVDDRLQQGPTQSETNHAALKANLIAKALIVTPTTQRFHFICAILIGHETEKARSQQASPKIQSELMSHQALGVVFGPLLLGNALNSSLENERLDGKPIVVPETPKIKRSRRGMRSSKTEQQIQEREQRAAVVLHENAKFTAVMAEMLISMWPGIVKQLRDIMARLHKNDPRLAPASSTCTLTI